MCAVGQVLSARNSSDGDQTAEVRRCQNLVVTQRVLVGTVAVVICLVMTGCGAGRPTGSVSGVVVVQGNPNSVGTYNASPYISLIPGSHVELLAGRHVVATAHVLSNMTFQLNGPAGTYSLKLLTTDCAVTNLIIRADTSQNVIMTCPLGP